MSLNELRLFALHTSRELGEQVARQLALPLSAHEEREFEDGEHKARPLQSVRGQDVYVLQSLHGEPGHSANDKLIRLLFFVAALKDAGAARVTALVPYLAYARKDRRSKARDPVNSRYVAQLFEAMGTDRVLTLDVHNLAAYQNAFRIPAEHLEAKQLFVAHFAPLLGREEVTVVSPDAGGVKRAEAFRQTLGLVLNRPVGAAFVEKYRSSGVVSGDALVGDVAGKPVIIIDDLISTGTTLVRAARACKDRGATRVRRRQPRPVHRRRRQGPGRRRARPDRGDRQRSCFAPAWTSACAPARSQAERAAHRAAVRRGGPAPARRRFAGGTAGDEPIHDGMTVPGVFCGSLGEVPYAVYKETFRALPTAPKTAVRIGVKPSPGAEGLISAPSHPEGGPS